MSEGRLTAPEFAFRCRVSAGWRVRRVDLHEELSGRFSATVDLDHAEAATDPGELLSASAALEMSRAGGSSRRFCGVVRSVDEPHGLAWGQRRRCVVRLEPAFLCLDEEIQTRPFVGLSVPQILREVLSEALGRFGGRGLELRLQRPIDDPGSARAYAVRELCVQYGESTYEFCRRLMAEEGMSHFFDHTGEVEKLIIVDEAQFERGGAPVRVSMVAGLAGDEEAVSDLVRVRTRAGPGVKLKPFDYLDPRARWDDSAGGGGEGLVYDPRPAVTLHGYAQGAYQRSDVVPQTEIRQQQLAADDDLVRGASNVIGLAAGKFLEVGGQGLAPWAAGEFLVTEVAHTAAVPEASAAGQENDQGYENTFTLLASRVQFRPQAVRKPTALEDWGLVLSAFEHDPIDTDRHGRVRVHFLYDRREDVTVDRRSCWIPVSQFWAGSGYGSQIIPRAGMLARLEYIFGDPDRPVVAECFPTGENRVPAALPPLKTRLTLRSHSLRDRGRDTAHFNEVALDDAAEKEEVFLHAGRNLRRKVLHDDRTETVHDEVHVVGRDQVLEVIANRGKTVESGESETVLQNRLTTIEADDEQTVALLDGAGGKDEDTVDSDAELRVMLTRTTTIQGLEKGTFNASRDREVEGLDALHVSDLRKVQADKVWRGMQGKTSVVLTEGNAHWKADGEIEASTPNARLVMKPDGPATLSVKSLKIACGASRITLGERSIGIQSLQVLVRGEQGSVKLDEIGAKTSGKNVTASAKILNELKGPLVMISDTPGAVDPFLGQRTPVQMTADAAKQLQLKQPEEEPLDLEVTLLGHDHGPVPNVDYQLMLPTGEILQGKTDGSGKLKQKVPGTARTALICYEPAKGAGLMSQSLALVEDGSEEAPVAHVRHLGYGSPTSPAEEVVREFQAAKRLPETGVADGATKRAIDELFAGKGR